MLKRKQLAIATASFVTEAVRSAANEAVDYKKKVRSCLMAKSINDHLNTLTAKFLWPEWCWGSLSVSRSDPSLLKSLGFSTEILNASKQPSHRIVHS